jgi:dTDP-4-dehydrorhamnose reductase
MYKILVTGSKGQLGNELQVLAAKFPQFSFHFHDIDTLDLTNHDQVKSAFDTIKPSFVINGAAYTAVDKAETEQEQAFKINAEAPGKLAEICQVYSCRLIHISTDYVYDGKAYLPYTETDPTNPLSVYGHSKLEGEKKVLDFPNTTVIRTSWLYSSFGHNFLKTILRLASEKNELTVVYDQIGCPTYARDLALAVLTIINKSAEIFDPNLNGIFNYSNEGVASWYDFAREIKKTLMLNCMIKPIETKDYIKLPATRPPYSVFNKAKIKTTFNIEIPHWADSLVDCCKVIK